MAENNLQYIVKSTLPRFEYPNVSVAEFFAERFIELSSDSDLIAFIDPTGQSQLTYKEFYQKVQELAYSLLQKGVKKSDVFLFFADNSIDHAVAIFAAIFIGVTVTLLQPASGPFELYDRIQKANITVLVYDCKKVDVIRKALEDEHFQKSIAQLNVFLQLDSPEPSELLRKHSITCTKSLITFSELIVSGKGKQLERIPHFPVDDLQNDHFLILFTSGSSGPPKTAIHSNHSFLSMQINLSYPEHFMGQRIAIPLPFGHMSGCTYMPLALSAGMTLVPLATSNVDHIMEVIARLRVNHYLFSVSAISALVANDYPAKFDLSSLKVLQYGGSKFPANILRELKAKYNTWMFECYGSTEFFGHVNILKYGKLSFDDFQPGNLGQVIPNVEMKIVDLKTGKTLPANEHGEICFKGSPCFIGYLNDEEATRNTIDSEGFYHSGDIGFFNEDHCLFVTDRIKELIKYKIWSVIPAEIEEFLYRHKAVAGACVIGVRHSTDGNLVRAYVQLADGTEVTEQELIDFVKDNMGFQKQLRGGVRFVSELPRIGVGKVDRQYFKQLVKDELITEAVP